MRVCEATHIGGKSIYALHIHFVDTVVTCL
jgi:hypothetical protein